MVWTCAPAAMDSTDTACCAAGIAASCSTKRLFLSSATVPSASDLKQKEMLERKGCSILQRGESTDFAIDRESGCYRFERTTMGDVLMWQRTTGLWGSFRNRDF
jgi:hypothetical protein